MKLDTAPHENWRRGSRNYSLLQRQPRRHQCAEAARNFRRVDNQQVVEEQVTPPPRVYDENRRARSSARAPDKRARVDEMIVGGMTNDHRDAIVFSGR